MSRGDPVSTSCGNADDLAAAFVLPPDSHARAIGLKMAVIARQMRQRFDERVEAMGVTRAKWTLIAVVARNPGATQRAIATSLEVTDVTAGRLIDRMCADGLLDRRENPQDRRAYCVYLAPGAKPLMEQLAVAVEGFELDIFGAFEAEELQQLDRMLDRISRNLDGSRVEPRRLVAVETA